MAGAPLETEPHRDSHASRAEQGPYMACSLCSLVYPSQQSWESATRAVQLIDENGVRTKSDEMRLCPCGAAMVRP